MDLSKDSLYQDFKNGIYYIPHGVHPPQPADFAEIKEGMRYFQVSSHENFADNYAAVNEIEAGEAAKILMHPAGISSLHHHSGCVVTQGKHVRMDTDAMIYHGGVDEGAIAPNLEEVSTEQGAMLLLKKTIMTLEVKSAITGHYCSFVSWLISLTGRDDLHAQHRVKNITTQVNKHFEVWQAMKLNPKKFRMTTRFGTDIPISHFTHADYMVCGVASPLFNPRACELLLAEQPPILPFQLSGSRFVPSFGMFGSLQLKTTSALTLFRQLKPFFRRL